MQFKNTRESYGLLTKAFHWLSALIILALILVGLSLDLIPGGPDKVRIIMLHKSFGLLILWMVGLRILWHLWTGKPAAHENHQWWERALARLTHIFLYIAMIGMPLSGWIMSSAGQYPVPFFGLQMPDLVGKDPDLGRLMHQVHHYLGYMLIAAVLLHGIGALKHHFIDKDTTFVRIAAGPMKKIGPYVATFILLLFAVLAGFILIKGQQQQVKTEQVAQLSTAQETASAQETDGEQSHQWKILPQDSILGFQASVYGKEFNGEFQSFTGTILFNPDNLSESRANIKIDITSVDSQDEERDATMLNKEWFHAEKYPFAAFEANDFEKQGEGQYIAHGFLTIKGTKVPVSLPFSLDITETGQQARRAEMEAQITLNRLDFKLGAGRWESADSVGLKVLVDIRVAATASD